MCTVTYVPTHEGVVFTSNRDEAKARDVDHLIKYSTQNKEVVMPPDHIGGTWIGSNSQGELVCLLNGAFEKHQHRPPYRHSRGIIVKKLLETNQAIHEFLRNQDLSGIEPFTLIYVSTEKLLEIRWDETILHIRNLDPSSAHIWSSSTLYDGATRGKKQDIFKNWLAKTSHIGREEIFEFHQSRPFGDGFNDLVMDRGVVATISITQIIKNGQNMATHYHNLLNHSAITCQIPISSP